jgi:FtsP/CotA-like multicopper oxidase with cupredoxin domain
MLSGISAVANMMDRRSFLGLVGAAVLHGNAQQAQPSKADFAIEIAPLTVELGPRNTFKTIGYNGRSPGPLLRVPEGKVIGVDVFNNTDVPELVHWHGLHIPSDVDGATEEGTPFIPPRGRTRLTFTASPSETRWYHTHGAAGRNLNRATYTGQFRSSILSRSRNQALTIRKSFWR